MLLTHSFSRWTQLLRCSTNTLAKPAISPITIKVSAPVAEPDNITLTGLDESTTTSISTSTNCGRMTKFTAMVQKMRRLLFRA